MPPPFANRTEAGRFLAFHLSGYADDPNLLILALPRGGVPVAHEVARALDAPLDVFIVRKLGVPGHEELAMGAIASGSVRVLNPCVIRQLQIPSSVIDQVAREEEAELFRRQLEYRGSSAPPDVRNRTIILIDDGLATGSTMRAAISALGPQHPAQLIVAVPVGAAETCAQLAREVDRMICPFTPQPFHAVGRWYRDFPQTTDQQVRRLLDDAAAHLHEHHHVGAQP